MHTQAEAQELRVEDSLLRKASELTGVKDKSALVRLALQTLVAIESAKRLAALGGTERKLRAPSRRRTSSV
jgi:Arc/MetJ family transcription regulator